ncbi:hypothetical protein [Streptosporangium nondiastaticum]|uniref:hypothetical protein n=1 Tax=Streptosporangium nondiastaticum TaxID=35764 RepID=UPI001CB8F2D2|nr:hypothetical protein [Streptosporangium nondiastaticum]
MTDHTTAQTATGIFVTQRNLLFTIAYETPGSAADAEALQETWPRRVKADLGQVRDQRAYLVRIATRQALNPAERAAERASGRCSCRAKSSRSTTARSPVGKTPAAVPDECVDFGVVSPAGLELEGFRSRRGSPGGGGSIRRRPGAKAAGLHRSR